MMTDDEDILQKCQITLEPPEKFDFPFPPYEIQRDFMTNLYKVIEEGKLGIFESPTGTGKSLSIICGALTWLRDHEEREQNELKKAIAMLDTRTESKSSSDWLSDQITELKNQTAKLGLLKKLRRIEKDYEKVEKIRKKFKELDIDKNKKINFLTKNRPKILEKTIEEELDDDKSTPLEEDQELILEDFGDEPEERSDSEEEEEDDETPHTKIIFCSRTHSQLSQFISEIQKTKHAEFVRIAPLASRQSYCINNAVNKLKNISLINEKCLELQKKGKSKTTLRSEEGERLKKKKGEGAGCPKMKGVVDLSEQLVTRVFDVEELRTEGDRAGACPYYASRAAVSSAQLIVVPYNTLLHKGTREACGLNLERSVVIIDEAHNLLETITHIHSTQLTGQQLTMAYNQLTQYKERYEKRFSALNLMYLKQLIYVIGNLIKLIGGRAGCSDGEATGKIIDTKLFTINDFVMTAQIDLFNMYKIVSFCQKSKIMHKINGFTEKVLPSVRVVQNAKPSQGIKAFLQGLSKKPVEEEETETAPRTERQTGQPLVSIMSFLENLTMNNTDGRIITTTAMTVGKATIKFLLLDPAKTFQDVIDKARSVILAGGTMEPKGELRERLFVACGAPKERTSEFSCGHVVSPDHILPIALASGPTGVGLDFSFNSRSSVSIMNELGRILVNISNLVPAGIVCFFPSYDFEKTVFEHLNKHGIIENIAKRKQIFREPKKSSEVDKVLNDYAKVIEKAEGKKGALLFSVVGGKLSEGLNFSDNLGRCVIVVGMPYPNIKSPELQEKMNYLNTHVGPGAGREHYEACCMKAVNQSIGRAVRHRGDYATVLLLDRRYCKLDVQALLPSWIMASFRSEEKFAPALGALAQFFKQRQKQDSSINSL